MKAYIDFKAIEEVPNKYNLHPADIIKLKVLDWDKIKKICWHKGRKKRRKNTSSKEYVIRKHKYRTYK